MIIQGLDWDLSLISKSLAELIEIEVKKFLQSRSERRRGEYKAIKCTIYSDKHDEGFFTVVKIGIGFRTSILQVLEFTYSNRTGNVWMDYSISTSNARDALDFVQS